MIYYQEVRRFRAGTTKLEPQAEQLQGGWCTLFLELLLAGITLTAAMMLLQHKETGTDMNTVGLRLDNRSIFHQSV